MTIKYPTITRNYTGKVQVGTKSHRAGSTKNTGQGDKKTLRFADFSLARFGKGTQSEIALKNK